MEQFFIVLNQIGIFLILIIVGIICMKTHILDEHSLGRISKFVIRAALPAYIFINTAEGATKEGLIESLVVIPLSIILYIVLILLSLLLERIFHLSGNRKKIFRAISTFGNIGFMGIPLVTAIYPDSAILYTSLFTILDQIFFWTYGITLTRPVSEDGGGLKPAKIFSAKNLKNLLSPALIAIIAATVLVILNLHLPDVIISALSALGNASMPMSLVYIGGILSITDIRPVLKCRELYAEIIIKMLVIPMVYYFVMTLIGINAEIAGTITFIAALPSINMVAMLAKDNGSDGDYAVCAVMMTTIACLVTLPLVSLGISLM